METLLGAFGLENRPWETPLGELSGGEKTRAGLAALVVSRPDYLLLDEPTNHLDAEGQRFLGPVPERIRTAASSSSRTIAAFSTRS